MSRSVRRTPIRKDHDSGKWGKRQANKKVRQEKDFAKNGKSYKKVYNTWDVHDFVSRYTQEDAIRDWYEEEQIKGSSPWRHKKYGTLEKWLIAWRKMMINK